MSVKTLNTRIRLKYDTLANWTTNNPVLLSGEVAVVAVPSGNGQLVSSITTPQILFKVGDGVSTFTALPWASGLAADVYSWAKKENLDWTDLNDTFKTNLSSYINTTVLPELTKASTSDYGVMKVGANLSVDNGVVGVGFGTTTAAGVLKVADNLSVGTAGEVGVAVGSASNLGVLQVGDNLSVANGKVGVGFGTTSSAGVLKVADNLSVGTAGEVGVRLADTSNFGVMKVGANLSVDGGVVDVDTSKITSKGYVDNAILTSIQDLDASVSANVTAASGTDFNVVTGLSVVETDGKLTSTSVSQTTLKKVASTGAAEDVSIVDAGNHLSSTNVEDALQELYDDLQTGGQGSIVTLSSVSGTGDVLKKYTIYQGGNAVGDIDIPKDYLVKSGSVQTCSADNDPIPGLVVGDKYLDFVVNTKDGSGTGTETHIYIPVKDLTDVYTGYTGPSIDVAVNGSNQISADFTAAFAQDYARKAYLSTVNEISASLSTSLSDFYVPFDPSDLSKKAITLGIRSGSIGTNSIVLGCGCAIGDGSIATTGGCASGCGSIATSGGCTGGEGSIATTYGRADGYGSIATSGGCAIGYGSIATTGGCASGCGSIATSGGCTGGEGSIATTGGCAGGGGSIATTGGQARGTGSIATTGGCANGYGSIAIAEGRAYGCGSIATTGGYTDGDGSIATNGGYAHGYGSIATNGGCACGCGSIALNSGTGNLSSTTNSFAWNGKNSGSYFINQQGSFAINPDQGLSGFYIGTDNLATILQNNIADLSNYAEKSITITGENGLSATGTLGTGIKVGHDTTGTSIAEQTSKYVKAIQVDAYGHITGATLSAVNVNDLEQTSGDYLELYCGSSSQVI